MFRQPCEGKIDLGPLHQKTGFRCARPSQTDACERLDCSVDVHTARLPQLMTQMIHIMKNNPATSGPSCGWRAAAIFGLSAFTMAALVACGGGGGGNGDGVAGTPNGGSGTPIVDGGSAPGGTTGAGVSDAGTSNGGSGTPVVDGGPAPGDFSGGGGGGGGVGVGGAATPGGGGTPVVAGGPQPGYPSGDGAAGTPNAGPIDPRCPWTDRSKTSEQRANLLLDASTVEQQMRWVNESSANDYFLTYIGPVAYPAQVPCIKFQADTDGPWGVAYAQGTTAFPVPVSQTASWDVPLMWERGQAIADEAWRTQNNTMFAPGVDIVRHPWGGRNAEYLGEDPFLAGTLAGYWVKAAREANPGRPVASVLKHFVGNQQELDRALSSSNIDARTLNEIYALPYEMAFKFAQPAGVMCGFNQLNGTFACENPALLKDLLRDQLGFKGFAVTDNGAGHSTGAALNAGLSQELSAPNYFTPDRLRAALATGEITEATIRDAAFRVLYGKFANGLMDYELPATGRGQDVRTPEHHALARKIAEQGSVLLKNKDARLPLRLSGKKIAVIGAVASNKPSDGASFESICTSPLYGAFDAAPVIYDCAKNGPDPFEAIKARAAKDGNTVVFDNGSNLAAAAKTAAYADVVIVFGFNRAGEFFDLPSMNLMFNGDALIDTVAKANPRTVVVLATAGPVLMPWLDKVPAILEAWYPGQAGGEAIAALLFGDVNPSGKLPVTFPKRLADLPTGAGDNDQYPGVFADGSTKRVPESLEIRQVNYKEGLQVGYRWYDAQRIEPLFAFGHGLSYTTFQYSDLKVATQDPTANGQVRTTLSFTVRNSGSVRGAEVSQVYLTLPSAASVPGKRLVGFDKITLSPGERKTVQVVVDSAASNHPFSVYDKAKKNWTIVNGGYTVSVGGSSRDLPLTASMDVKVSDRR